MNGTPVSKNDELRYGPLGSSCVHICVDMQRLFAEPTEWFIHERISKLIDSGVKKLDGLLLRLTQNGTLIELVGKKGAGRTHLVYLICSLNSIRSKKTLYLDGSGNFRPEVINEYLLKIANANDEELKKFLKKITYQRIYEVDKLILVLKRIKVLEIDCVIFDDVIPLFLYNQNKNIRQEVRRFIREIAFDCHSQKDKHIFYKYPN